MYVLRLQLPGRPSRETLELVGLGLLVANSRWFAAAGRAAPRTCVAAGVHYRADKPAHAPTYRGASAVLHAGEADCFEAAAYDGGALLGADLRLGYSLEALLPHTRIELVHTPNPHGTAAPHWHARLRWRGRVYDPTLEMIRCSSPSGRGSAAPHSVRSSDSFFARLLRSRS